MTNAFPRIAATLLCAALAACGGGGGTSAPANNTSGNAAANDISGIGPATGATSTSTPANNSTATGASGTGTVTGSGSGSGAGAVPGSSTSGASAGSGATGAGQNAAPETPFVAVATIAPDENSVLKGIVTFEVRGSSLENVELLPSAGYAPRLGVFTVSADKTSAVLQFDTTSLPNGTLTARISAFDKPAGDPDAREIIAMPARSWQLGNMPNPAPAQIPPASVMPRALVSFLNLPYVDPAPLDELRQLDDASLQARLSNDWPQVEALLLRYIPANVALDFPTPLSFDGPWDACLRVHGLIACREAINGVYGLMIGKRP